MASPSVNHEHALIRLEALADTLPDEQANALQTEINKLRYAAYQLDQEAICATVTLTESREINSVLNLLLVLIKQYDPSYKTLSIYALVNKLPLPSQSTFKRIKRRLTEAYDRYRLDTPSATTDDDMAYPLIRFNANDDAWSTVSGFEENQPK